jgi:hypothetical protein
VTVSQKAALTLLISVVLFAGFTVLAFTGLFDLVEARFYNPSITASLTREIEQDTKTIQDFLSELQSRFAVTLQETSVKRSFLPNQSAEDIFERTRIYGILIETQTGLQSVRFVDAGGIRIHFSTYGADILRQDRLSIAYRNYDDMPGNIPYDQVEVPNQGNIKLTLDEAGDRIIFSLPFYDSFDVYRGTALFSLSVRAVAERLINEGRVKIGEDVSILSNPPGVLAGLPNSARNALIPKVASVWTEGLLTLTPLDSADSGVSLALISSKTSQEIYVGRLVNESLFAFPYTMKLILLVSFFLTVYLSVFLIFNLRQDSMTVIQNRLKRLQISLIEQYYDRKSDMDWGHWSRELEQRRDEIRSELKQGIKVRSGRRADDDIDTLIDKSWDELLTVIGGRQDKVTANIDEEKLQNILNRILSASAGGVPVVQAPASAVSQAPAAVRAQPSAEEPEELDGAEAVEELGEAESVEELDGAETVEELGEAESVEELDGAEAVEELSEAESVEELDGAEAVEELSEVESVEELDGTEIAGTTNPAATKGGSEQQSPQPAGRMKTNNEPEALEELDAGEITENIEEVEELEEIEALEEVEEVEPAGKLSNMPETDIGELASRIEFSPVPDSDEDAEKPLEIDLEIVSPFATVISGFTHDEEETEAASEGTGLAAEETPIAPATDAGDEKKNSRKIENKTLPREK